MSSDHSFEMSNQTSECIQKQGSYLSIQLGESPKDKQPNHRHMMFSQVDQALPQLLSINHSREPSRLSKMSICVQSQQPQFEEKITRLRDQKSWDLEPLERQQLQMQCEERQAVRLIENRINQLEDIVKKQSVLIEKIIAQKLQTTNPSSVRSKSVSATYSRRLLPVAVAHREIGPRSQICNPFSKQGDPDLSSDDSIESIPSFDQISVPSLGITDQPKKSSRPAQPDNCDISGISSDSCCDDMEIDEGSSQHQGMMPPSFMTRSMMSQNPDQSEVTPKGNLQSFLSIQTSKLSIEGSTPKSKKKIRRDYTKFFSNQNLNPLSFIKETVSIEVGDVMEQLSDITINSNQTS